MNISWALTPDTILSNRELIARSPALLLAKTLASTPLLSASQTHPKVVLNGLPLLISTKMSATPTGRAKSLISTKNPIVYDACGFRQPKVSARIGISEPCMIKA